MRCRVSVFKAEWKVGVCIAFLSRELSVSGNCPTYSDSNIIGIYENQCPNFAIRSTEHIVQDSQLTGWGPSGTPPPLLRLLSASAISLTSYGRDCARFYQTCGALFVIELRVARKLAGFLITSLFSIFSTQDSDVYSTSLRWLSSSMGEFSSGRLGRGDLDTSR